MSRDPDLIVSDFEYLDLNSNVNWLMSLAFLCKKTLSCLFIFWLHHFVRVEDLSGHWLATKIHVDLH